MKKYIQPNIKVTTVASEIICTSNSVGFNNECGFEDGTGQLGKDRGWEEDEPEF